MWIAEEEMPFSKENEEWIRAEIQTAINPTGWKKALTVLLKWAPLGAILTIVISLFAIIAMLGVALVNRRDVDIKFQTNTESFQKQTDKRLEAIEGKFSKLDKIDNLLDLLKPFIDQKLRAAASLPTKEFSQQLANVQKALDLARDSNLIPPPGVLPEIGKRLQTINVNSPSYWQTTAAFVSYRSSSGGTIARFLPPCASVDMPMVPGKTKVRVVGTETETDITGPAVTSDCTVQLDNHRIIGYVFKNCVVVYRGGPMHLENVRFENCIFKFDVTTDKTPQEAQRLIMAVLGSDTSKSIAISNTSG